MKILVCVKQVPETETALALDRARRWVQEGGSFDLNDYDRYALEEALRIKDKDAGSEVVVASLGPERASQALRTCLAMGADRAVHLADPAFQDGDPFATARALAAVAKRESPDLLLVGLQAEDDNYCQTGVVLAEMLGLPHATGVMAMSLLPGGQGVRAERELEGERRLVVEMPLPAVVTVQTGINQPRYASLRGIMAAKKKELKALSPADLGLDPAKVGAAGALVERVDLDHPPKGKGGELLKGTTEEMARELVRRIREKTGVI